MHARHAAVGRAYRYVVVAPLGGQHCDSEGSTPVHMDRESPFWRGRAWQRRRPLREMEAMVEAAALIGGLRDWSSLRAAHCQASGPVRTITRTSVDVAAAAPTVAPPANAAVVSICVEAPSFLYHMVRNIAGSLVAVGEGKISVPQLKELLDGRDRNALALAGGVTAPAHGLYLEDVFYAPITL